MNYVYKCKYRSGFVSFPFSFFVSTVDPYYSWIPLQIGLLANICNPHGDLCGALWSVVCRHKLHNVDLPDSDGTRPSSASLVPLPACRCPLCSQLSATFFRFLSFLLTSLCKAAPKRSADVLPSVPREGADVPSGENAWSASFRHEA